MGEYIGDKSRGRSGNSSKKNSGGDTKQFDLKSNAKTSSPASRKSGSAQSGGKNSSQRSSSGSSKNSSAAGRSGSASSGRSASSKTGSSKSTSSKGGSSGSKPNSGSRSSSSQKSRSTANTKRAYSAPLEAKKGSDYERELRSSDRARDIQNARRRRNYSKHRKLFNFMFYAAIFIAVVAVVIIMSVTVLFGIQDINVVFRQEVPYSEQEIISSCDVKRGQNLFLAPVEEAGEQIMQQLPYIEECSVSRKLPSTILIEVTAAEAAGVVRDEAGRLLVVSTGMRTLEYVVSDGDAPGVPRISGVLVSNSDIGDIIKSADMSYIRVAINMSEHFLEKDLMFDGITFSAGGHITAEYDGRITIDFGTSANIEDKLQLAEVLINEGKITKHEAGNLDLSIEGRATFTPDYVKKEEEQ